MSETCIFTFPKEDVIEHWIAIQDYARRTSADIEWDDNRQVLVATGKSIDPHRVIDDIGRMLYAANGKESEFYWDRNWYCDVQFGSQSVRLLIVGDRDDSMASLRRSKAIAMRHLEARLPEWMRMISDQIYPVYFERFCGGTPCSREDFHQSLHISDCITFDPTSNRYEIYVEARSMIDTHLINLVENNGVLYEARLERV